MKYLSIEMLYLWNANLWTKKDTNLQEEVDM